MMDAGDLLSGADVIAERLAEAGCRHAFGIPGGEVLALVDALERHGIRFHLCKHETPGGLMAEGTFHATAGAGSAPAILLATVGPGVANAVNGVANAYLDQVPMIFLTGAVDPDDAPTYTHQVFDHCALLGPVTKASFQLTSGNAHALIDKAVALALEDRPGPVHVDVPIAVQRADAPRSSLVRKSAPVPAAPAPGPDLEAAREMFLKAERPLCLAGVDVLHHGAEDQVRRLVKDFGVPLISTYKAKGVVDERDPLCISAAALSPLADKELLPLVHEADLIMLAGYDPVEMRIGWRNPFDAKTKIIEIAAKPNTHYVHQADWAFAGDVGAGLGALMAGLPPTPDRPWAKERPAEVRSKLKQLFASNGRWGPAAVIEGVRAALPDEGVVTIDTGAHRILANQAWEAPLPCTVLQSMGLCTMGTALPLAIGRKLAGPETPVVALTGDAGLEMVLGELATLRDLGLPIVIVVFVDFSLALIELKQRSTGYQNAGVDFGGTDFVSVAKAFAGEGVIAKTAQEVEEAVKDALERPTFTVIACPIGARAYDGKI